MFDELDNVKHFLDLDVYNRYCDELLELNKRNLRHIYEELNVKNVIIVDTYSLDGYDYIALKLYVRYMDYFVNKESNEYISGNNKTRSEYIYSVTFKKKEKTLDLPEVRKCPGCGSSINVNGNGKCSFCGSIYNLSDYYYILDKICKI